MLSSNIDIWFAQRTRLALVEIDGANEHSFWTFSRIASFESAR